MTARSELIALLARDRGTLLRVEFLDAAGYLAYRGRDSIVAARDLRLTPLAVAFFWLDGERVHAHGLRSVVRSGDEWILQLTDLTLRIVASPIHLEEQRQQLARWLARTPDADTAIELDRFVRVAAHRRERQRHSRARVQCFHARWHARLGGGRLVNVGVLLLGPDGQLRFFGFLEHSSFERVLNSELSGALLHRPAKEVFERLGGNEQTTSWSQPFAVREQSIEVAAARVLGSAQRGGTIAARPATGSRLTGGAGKVERYE